MKWRWQCPKPQSPEKEVTFDSLRPLLLLEVICKLWTGIIVGRITRHRVLATGQQGFPPVYERTGTCGGDRDPAIHIQMGHQARLRLRFARGDEVRIA